jgi:hypothetical protein
MQVTHGHRGRHEPFPVVRGPRHVQPQLLKLTKNSQTATSRRENRHYAQINGAAKRQQSPETVFRREKRADGRKRKRPGNHYGKFIRFHLKSNIWRRLLRHKLNETIRVVCKNTIQNQT